MGAGGASTGGGGGVGPAGIKTDGTYGTKKDAKQASKRNEFRVSGARDIDNLKLPGATNLLKGPLKAGSKITRDFFTNKVLTSKRGKKNIGYNKQQFESLSIAEQNKIYSGYVDDRLSNKTDAYGNTLSGGGNDNDRGGQDQPVEPVIVKKNEPVIVKKNIGGTEVQTTQAKIDDQRAKDNEYDIRKIKKRGRRNILTSSKGVTTVSSDYSLGKRSLLGSV
jgi:hypothetical protein